MKDFIAKLEATTEVHEGIRIREALDLARNRKWISVGTYVEACAWVRSGAYLSAAMVLIPEGWLTYKMQQFPSVHPRLGNKWLWNLAVFGSSKQAEGIALTLALAIAIAALKAHDVK